MTVKCKNAEFKLGSLPLEYFLRGLAARIHAMDGQEITEIINEGMQAAEDTEAPFPLQFSPEELDVIMHACFYARQHHEAEKHEASDEGDYETVGQVDEMSKRLWLIIAKIKSSRR